MFPLQLLSETFLIVRRIKQDTIINANRFKSILKLQSNRAFNIYISKRCFYIVCLNNYKFRPLYRPSSGSTLPYYKANYTVYNVLRLLTRSHFHFTNVNEISSTNIVYCIVCLIIRKCTVQPDDGRNRGRNMYLLRQAM